MSDTLNLKVRNKVFEDSIREDDFSLRSIESEGILPISQSSVLESEFLADFDLTASGESRLKCKDYFWKGCLNSNLHEGITLEGTNFSGQVYIELHKNSCHRQVCPICWEDWAGREVDRASQRIEAYVLKNYSGSRNKPIHVMVSVCKADYGLSFQDMRRKVYKILKQVKCIGGMCVYHPKRFNKRGKWYKEEYPLNAWYYSPHFHIVGYGWVFVTRQIYNFYGYFVKNIGIRKTVKGTIWYELSHCAAIPEGGHAITWFGNLSYNNLKVKYVKKENVCPICGATLHKVLYCGKVFSQKDLIKRYMGIKTFFDIVTNWHNDPGDFTK